MSKIHFEPVLAVSESVDGLRVKFNTHPEDKSANILYYSVERFIEHCKPAVGAVFAYISATSRCCSWNDRTLPYGTVVLKRGFDWTFGDYIIITEDGWKWAHDGSLSIHLEKKKQREEEAARDIMIMNHPKLSHFPESVRKCFYHEGLV